MLQSAYYTLQQKQNVVKAYPSAMNQRHSYTTLQHKELRRR